mgnify:CR=1 FL=1
MRILDGEKLIGNLIGHNDGSTVFEDRFYILLDGFFRIVIQRRGGFIEYNDRWIVEEDAGDVGSWPLTTGQFNAHLTNHCIASRRKSGNEVMGEGQ